MAYIKGLVNTNLYDAAYGARESIQGMDISMANQSHSTAWIVNGDR